MLQPPMARSTVKATLADAATATPPGIGPPKVTDATVNITVGRRPAISGRRAIPVPGPKLRAAKVLRQRRSAVVCGCTAMAVTPDGSLRLRGDCIFLALRCRLCSGRSCSIHDRRLHKPLRRNNDDRAFAERKQVLKTAFGCRTAAGGNGL